MDFVRGFFLNCWEQVGDFAAGVSESFTGADSGAALIMLIFYLVLATIVLLLLTLLVRSIRSFFAALFGKTKKKKVKKYKRLAVQTSSAENIEATGAQRPLDDNLSVVSCPHGNPCQRGSFLFAVESFDGQSFLERLSAAFNDTNTIYSDAIVPSHITKTVPQTALSDGGAGDIQLSAEDMSEIAKKFEGHDLAALRHIFDVEGNRCAELEEKISVVCDRLSSSRDEREKLSAEEAATLEKHNAIVDEIAALNDRAYHQKELLSIDYSKLFKQISDYIVLRSELLGNLERLGESIGSVPASVDSFGHDFATNLRAISAERIKKDEALNVLKNSYTATYESGKTSDEIICSLQSSLAALQKERLVRVESVAYLRVKLEDMEKQEAARLAEEEATKRAAEEAARTVREEAECLAQPEKDLHGSSSEVNAVMETVQKQAQEAYALNYDDISPDMCEKIVASMKRHKPTTPVDAEEADPQMGHAESVAVLPSDIAPELGDHTDLSGTSECGPEDAQTNVDFESVKPDYFAELKQEWAAEREHKMQWQAEQEQKKADEARRMQELLGHSKTNNGADDGN